MKFAVETGIPSLLGPTSRAIIAGETLYTTVTPVKADGTVERGSIDAQGAQTLQNLAKVMEAAGGSMADVTQATLYVTDWDYIHQLTELWEKAFSPPYPNRSAVVVSGLSVRGTGLLIVAQGFIEKSRQRGT